MGKTPRTDKGRNRSVWVDVPCSGGCGKRVKRPRSRLRERNYCSPECYRENGAAELGRLGGRPSRIKALEAKVAAYELLYGSLPEES